MKNKIMAEYIWMAREHYKNAVGIFMEKSLFVNY